MRGVLIDIDGVLTVSWEPIDGAVDAVRAIREAGLPFALITNTTSRTRHRIAATLTDAGLQLDSGAFLLGLERAAGVEATVLGKPAEAFYAAALRTVGVDAADA